MEHLFSGNALCAIDSDGILRLPDFVRFTLGNRSDSNVVMISPHAMEPCLTGYDRGHGRRLYADHERLRLTETGAETHHNRARRTFGTVEEGHYQPDGEMALPLWMRRKGRIEDLALFIGTGGMFEIWNPRLAIESDDENLSEIAAWQCQDILPPAR